jgi:hypothetical protein
LFKKKFKKIYFSKKKKKEKKEPVGPKPPPNKRNTEHANDIERNLHYYIYRQAGQSLILFHFQQSFGLPNPPPFIPRFHTFSGINGSVSSFRFSQQTHHPPSEAPPTVQQ